MLQNSPTSIYKLKSFSGGNTPKPSLKEREGWGGHTGREEGGMGWEMRGEGGRRSRGMKGEVCVTVLGG